MMDKVEKDSLKDRGGNLDRSQEPESKKTKLDTEQNIQSSDNEQSEPEDDDMTILSGNNPEQILLRIPDICDKVLDLLSADDLKILRGASLVWNNIAITKILEEESPAVTFEFDEKNQEYGALSKYGRKMFDLRALPSMTFPCNNFRILCEGDISITKQEWVVLFKTFFDQIGPQIKTLHLGTHHGLLFLDMGNLHTILLHQAANIVSLELGYCCNLEWNESNRLTLPHLKKLTCPSPSSDSTVFDMLKEAPKLESVYNFKLKYTNSFLSKFKIDIIKTLESHGIYDLSTIQNFVTLANALPKLTSLSLYIPPGLSDEQRQDFILALNMILKSSKESLTILKAVTVPMSGRIEISNLQNVKEVEFDLNNCYDMFMTEMFVSRFVPIAESLKYTIREISPRYHVYRVGPHPTLPKVNSLTFVISSLSLSWCLRQSWNLLPNVTKLTISMIDLSNYDYTDLLGVIFAYYPNIPELCLSGNSMERFLTDSVITGIPARMCSRIVGEMTGDEIERKCGVKNRRGIPDFTSLRHLKIILENVEWTESDIDNVKWPTWISSSYGFNRVSGLRVTIALNQNCLSGSKLVSALSSISSVTFVHHQTV